MVFWIGVGEDTLKVSWKYLGKVSGWLVRFGTSL
jgi:hypothetical protein